MFDRLTQAFRSGVFSWFGGGLAPRAADGPHSPCQRAPRRGFAAAQTRVPSGSGAASGHQRGGCGSGSARVRVGVGTGVAGKRRRSGGVAGR